MEERSRKFLIYFRRHISLRPRKRTDNRLMEYERKILIGRDELNKILAIVRESSLACDGECQRRRRRGMAEEIFLRLKLVEQIMTD